MRRHEAVMSFPRPTSLVLLMVISLVFVVDAFSIHRVYRATVPERHSIEIETGIFRTSSSDPGLCNL